MTQAHSPAVIAAAKVLAEKHGCNGLWFKTATINALCEALTTTLPSEEAMSCPDDFAIYSKPAPKPEPIAPQASLVTEDHLRRACKLIGLHFDHYSKRTVMPLIVKAVEEIARLLAERDAMQARVEGKPVGEIISYRQTICSAVVKFYPTLNGGVPFDIGDVLYVGKPAQPTPDPDLVLAERIADEECPRNDKFRWTTARDAALRALKLKGQAHDQ